MVYENAAHAEKAMRQYNNVQLDGNAMQVGTWAGQQQGLGDSQDDSLGPAACLIHTFILIYSSLPHPGPHMAAL